MYSCHLHGGPGLQWGPGTTTPKGATPLQPFLTLQFYVIATTAAQALSRVLFGCRDNSSQTLRSRQSMTGRKLSSDIPFFSMDAFLSTMKRGARGFAGSDLLFLKCSSHFLRNLSSLPFKAYRGPHDSFASGTRSMAWSHGLKALGGVLRLKGHQASIFQGNLGRFGECGKSGLP